MLHIFLTILKIPFLLLAALLLLLLAVLLLLLFVPVRYRLEAEKGEGVAVLGRAHWLFHFLSVRADYHGGRFALSVRLCGYPLVGEKKADKSSSSGKKKTVKRKKPESQRTEAAQEEIPEPKRKPKENLETMRAEQTGSLEPKQEDAVNEFVKPEKEAGEPGDLPELERADAPEQIREPQREETQAADEEAVRAEQTGSSEQIREPQREETQAEDEEAARKPSSAGLWDRLSALRRFLAEKWDGLLQKFRRLRKKAENSFRGVLDKIRNIRETFARFRERLETYCKWWYDEHTQAAFMHIKKELFYLSRHYLPGRVEGRLLFGADDPATTGQLLGLLSVMQVFGGNQLQLQADFENRVLEGEIALRGHLRICHVIKAGLALILDRHCRVTYNRFQKIRSH